MGDVEELRDIVSQTLESKGVLAKMRAELRKHVFLAIEEQEEPQRPATYSKAIELASSAVGNDVFAVVEEFLRFYELDFTLSVLQAEAKRPPFTGPAQLHQIRSRLGLDTTDKQPLLVSVLQRTGSVQSSSSAAEEKEHKEKMRADTAPAATAPAAVRLVSPPPAINTSAPSTTASAFVSSPSKGQQSPSGGKTSDVEEDSFIADSQDIDDLSPSKSLATTNATASVAPSFTSTTATTSTPPSASSTAASDSSFPLPKRVPQRVGALPSISSSGLPPLTGASGSGPASAPAPAPASSPQQWADTTQATVPSSPNVSSLSAANDRSSLSSPQPSATSQSFTSPFGGGGGGSSSSGGGGGATSGATANTKTTHDITGSILSPLTRSVNAAPGGAPSTPSPSGTTSLSSTLASTPTLPQAAQTITTSTAAPKENKTRLQEVEEQMKALEARKRQVVEQTADYNEDISSEVEEEISISGPEEESGDAGAPPPTSSAPRESILPTVAGATQTRNTEATIPDPYGADPSVDENFESRFDYTEDVEHVI